MSFWWSLLFFLVLLSIIIMMIAENRHPLRTIAWIMVLVFLPGLGLVLYLVFGRDNRNRRLVSDADLRRFKANTSRLYALQICSRPEPPEKDLINLLWGCNLAFPLTGNSLKVYTNFDTMYADMLTDMRNAKNHIHFEFFKFEDDPVGELAARILIDKAKAGLEVRVQYDDAANLQRKAFFKRLRKEGVMVQPFLKVPIPFISSSTNYRNHRKVVVIDGTIGYIGGMNVAQRYSTGIRGGVWRDTHIRVTGPAVSEMQTSFLVDWQFSSKAPLFSEKYYPQAPTDGDILMQVATSGPMDEWRVIMQGIVQMIAQSKEYIYIQSPYLIPTEPVLLALRNAALSGVDVRIMIPYRGDRGIVVPLASRSYVKDVVSAGVKVDFYENGYMHSKAIVSDDRVVTIGSTNMDVRSYEQDFEINAFIYDRELAKKMKHIFLEDEKHTWRVDPEKWADRPWPVRFKESLSRLLSPLL